MLDLLPKEVWTKPEFKFLDPATKSGVFLREIFYRLYDGLDGKGVFKANDGKSYDLNIPQERINHILKNMIYAISISELTAYVARRTLYGVMEASTDKKTAVRESFMKSSNYDVWSEEEQLNFLKRNKLNEYFDLNIFKTKEYEGFEDEGNIYYPSDEVAKKVLDEGILEVEDTYFPFINDETKHKKILDIKEGRMKFDVIIGNPPYQVEDKGFGKSAKPIYNLFIEQAKKLNPKYISLIVPSRWFAGGKGLNSFRENMLNDKSLKKIVDFTDARDCFPSVDIAGGVNYFLWERDYNGDCEVTNIHKGNLYKSTRPLNQFSTFIRFSVACDILQKIQKFQEKTANQKISSTNPFGLKTSDRPNEEGELTLVSSQITGPVQKERIKYNIDIVTKWKVMTSKASHDHAGQPDKDGMRRVLSKLEILEPNVVCTGSYIILDSFNNKKEAENYISYMKTKLVRFLISLLSFSQDITRDRFSFVPLQDFSESWTDEKLYKKYGINQEEQAFIDKLIKPMSI
jgi:site-specific DNA-methyltransferase (adenine-specific)